MIAAWYLHLPKRKCSFSVAKRGVKFEGLIQGKGSKGWAGERASRVDPGTFGGHACPEVCMEKINGAGEGVFVHSLYEK